MGRVKNHRAGSVDAQAHGKQRSLTFYSGHLFSYMMNHTSLSLMGESAFGGCQEEWDMSDYTVLSVKFGAGDV